MAKLKIDLGFQHEALVNLWTNINYFIVEISVRMNEFTLAMHCQNPKMKKLCKYLIITLVLMTKAYVELEEIGAVGECQKMIEWFNESFFEQEERFFQHCLDIMSRCNQYYIEDYEEKCEMIR